MKTYALILGVSSGFGKATALELAKHGYNIYGVHMDMGSNRAKAEEFRQELLSLNVDAVFFNINAADDKRRGEVVAEIKKLEANDSNRQLRVLIHSLAFGALKALVSTDTDKMLTRKQIEMTMDVMANSLIYWTQDLVSNNLLVPNSRILAFSSIGASRAMHAYGAVSAAKAALESYIRQLAIELAPMGISSNAIFAGLTHTPAASKIPGFNSMLKLATKQNPFGRLTTPEDVAVTVRHLVDPDWNWINGEVVRVDGGDAIYEYFENEDEA